MPDTLNRAIGQLQNGKIDIMLKKLTRLVIKLCRPKGDMCRRPKTAKMNLRRNRHCVKFHSGPYKTSHPEYTMQENNEI